MRSISIVISLLGLLGVCGCSKMDPVPADKPSPALTLSNEREIAYMIEREVQGQPKPVAADFEFHSGDSFRLRFRPGFSAYIYVANRGNHESSYHMLFPATSEHNQNPISKGTVVAVPIDTEWLRFDNVPGNEYLVLIGSTVPLPALEKTAEMPRDTFDATLAEIDRQFRPTSSRLFLDSGWTKFFAARDGDLAIVTRLALRHQ